MAVEQKDTVPSTARVKVVVRCRNCGRQFVLRGTPKEDGQIETGFKMCLCDSTDVEVTIAK